MCSDKWTAMITTAWLNARNITQTATNDDIILAHVVGGKPGTPGVSSRRVGTVSTGRAEVTGEPE